MQDKWASSLNAILAKHATCANHRSLSPLKVNSELVGISRLSLSRSEMLIHVHATKESERGS